MSTLVQQRSLKELSSKKRAFSLIAILHFSVKRCKVYAIRIYEVILLSKLRQILLGSKQDVNSLRNALPILALLTGSIIFWELLMHFEIFETFNSRFAFVVLFSLFFGLLFTVVVSLLNRWGKVAALWVVQGLLYLWYASQLIYFRIFGGCISVYLIKLGGDAITSFFKETVSCIGENILLLAFMALPLVITGVTLKLKCFGGLRRARPRVLIQMAALCVLLHLVCLGSTYIGGTGAYTVYDVYHNVNTPTDTSVVNLGYLTTFRLELKSMLMGADKESNGVGDLVIPEDPNWDDIFGKPDPTDPPSNLPTDPDASVPPTEPPITYYDQVLQIDFDALIAQAEADGNSALATLHQYFSTQRPTQTNEYTGMFKDYNLIYMVCESFSPEVISEEMTPTLYKLYNEGIQFTNFYGTYRNVTTNGEYTACLGIFPDLSRKKSDASFKASIGNHLPFALGNIFQEQLGIQSHGYHNYKGSYYSRNETHPNMGYTCKFMNAGMKFTTSWPSSDLEMMKQSVADYINEDQFHAYYMTFSGHYKYDFVENPMCIRNQAAVEHLDNSEAVRAYIACHLELEYAMSYLMEQLEAAGKLSNTVIVMTTDHYPYGLNSKQYNELAGEKKDSDFGIYENAFICWAEGVDIEIDTPCCTVDILPTLLNLFGFEYDSRLLIGQDVLDPNALHVAILHNGSFITDKVMFNSSNGKVTYLVDEAEVPEQYVPLLNQIVQNKFTVSTSILNYDYYRIVLPPTEE